LPFCSTYLTGGFWHSYHHPELSQSFSVALLSTEETRVSRPDRSLPTEQSIAHVPVILGHQPLGGQRVDGDPLQYGASVFEHFQPEAGGDMSGQQNTRLVVRGKSTYRASL